MLVIYFAKGLGYLVTVPLGDRNLRGKITGFAGGRAMSAGDATYFVLSCNKSACCARQRGDLSEALGYLWRALDEGERASISHLALTYSNISAILSKIGRHPLALRYAHSAVMHCKQALGADVEESHRTVMALAVACYNLAVQMEFVRGPACLRWYAKATSFAEKAAHLASVDESSDNAAVPTEPMELGNGIGTHPGLQTVASISRRISLSHIAAARKWAKKGYDIRQESSESAAALAAAGCKGGAAKQGEALKSVVEDMRDFDFDLGGISPPDSDPGISYASLRRALSNATQRPDDGCRREEEELEEPADEIPRNGYRVEEAQHHLGGGALYLVSLAVKRAPSLRSHASIPGLRPGMFATRMCLANQSVPGRRRLSLEVCTRGNVKPMRPQTR